ncbi:MAG: hypothetical protein WHS63_12515, partial [Tenuifilum sp.]
MKRIPHQLRVIENKPLDGRVVCNTLDEAMALAYDGLICYIRSEKKHYRFKEINYVLTAIPDEVVDVSGFATKSEVNAKADKSYVDSGLSQKSNVGHSHPDYAPINHSHDYIPTAELPNLATKTELAGKASVTHNHDDRYSSIGHAHSNYQLDIESLQNLVNTGRLSLTQLNTDYITRQEYVQGAGVQQYVHPETHPSSMITTTPDRRFTSDSEMNSKVDKAEGYGLISDADRAKLHEHNNSEDLSNVSGINTGDENDTTLGTKIAGATAKTTPVDADSMGLSDSEASNLMKKLTWANLKAALKGYFDTLYTTLTSAAPSALGASASVGTATTAARADHVHPLPAVATTSSNGLMSSTDKTKLDGITGTNTGDETTTTLGTKIAGATQKSTPVDADKFGYSDSAASNVLKYLTWANIKAALKSYFDTIYATLSVATTSTNGLMSSTDKTKLDGIASGATNTPLTSSAPAALGASASVGTATTAARADHVHPLPAVATTSSNGLMSSTDKTKLNGITGTNTGDETTTTLGTKIAGATQKST